jgi:hypothetical protein
MWACKQAAQQQQQQQQHQCDLLVQLPAPVLLQDVCLQAGLLLGVVQRGLLVLVLQQHPQQQM